MLLTGQEVAKHLKTTTTYHKINQVGVDLSVQKIEKILGWVKVYTDKTVVSPEGFQEMKLHSDETGRQVWLLSSGVYALTFNEGVKIPANATGLITSRSSIYRGGAHINSPIWDPGFETEQMGTTMVVHAPIVVEHNARVGQFYMIQNPEVADLYNGQFQGKVNY